MDFFLCFLSCKVRASDGKDERLKLVGFSLISRLSTNKITPKNFNLSNIPFSFPSLQSDIEWLANNFYKEWNQNRGWEIALLGYALIWLCWQMKWNVLGCQNLEAPELALWNMVGAWWNWHIEHSQKPKNGRDMLTLVFIKPYLMFVTNSTSRIYGEKCNFL